MSNSQDPTTEHHSSSAEGAAALDPSELLEHLDWVRGLARRLARDESSADDLVQRTFLSALRWPARVRLTQPRAWLHSVLRNEAQKEWRGTARRQHREEVAVEAAPGEAADPAEVEERFELQRELVGVIDALDERYRTVVLLRYFEDRTPTEIAEQLDVPVNTITSRLMRARGQLRDRLDGSYGSRSAWSAVALRLPLPASPEASLASTSADLSSLASPSSAGGFTASVGALLASSLAMKVLVSLGTAVALFLLVHTTLQSRPIEPISDLAPRVTDEGPVEAIAAPSLELAEPRADRESAGAADAVGAPAEPETTVAVQTFRGRVVDADGTPCAGIVLRPDQADASHLTITSDANGAMSFELGASARTASFRWVAASPDWVTLLTTTVDARFMEDDHEAFVVVTRTEHLHGTVVDTDGTAIADATVTLELPEGFRARYDALLASTIDQSWETTADAAGRFEIPNAPTGAGALVSADAIGFFAKQQVAVEDVRDGDGHVEVVLRSLDPARFLRGIVLDEVGLPVEGASVAFDERLRVTASDGTFLFHLDEDGLFRSRATSIVALQAGRLPATFTAPTGPAGTPTWPSEVELRLGPTALTIEGQVVNDDGSAVSGAKVWVTDVTVVAADGNMTAVTAESLLRGDETFWHTVVTDDSGHFTLDGLTDRAYSLCALRPDTVELTPVTEVVAGVSKAVLRFANSNTLAPLSGRVVNAAGDALAGVDVEVSRETFRASVRAGGTRMERAAMVAIATDESGRFMFTSLPLDPSVSLVFTRPGYSTRWISREKLTIENGEAVITLHREAQVRFRLADDAAEIDQISFVNADGDRVMFHQHVNGVRHFMRYVELTDGNSQTLVISDEAVRVEYWRGSELVWTTPLELDFEAPAVISR